MISSMKEMDFDYQQELVQRVVRTVSRVAKQVAGKKGEGAEERLMGKPIDLLCFGRAGVGKTTFLESLTGHHLGSSPSVDHGTSKLECCTVAEHIPCRNGASPSSSSSSSSSVDIRFWDTKGIESWSSDTCVSSLFKELEDQRVNPLCVFYCATGSGRVESEVVTRILKHFLELNIAVFYILTNIYNHSTEQFKAQVEGAISIMTNATGARIHTVVSPHVYRFKDRAYIVGVNSKTYDSMMGSMPPLNVNITMELVMSALNEQQITQFFLATLNNRSFWDKAHDFIRTMAIRVENWEYRLIEYWEEIFKANKYKKV